jgi:hypothetical protein
MSLNKTNSNTSIYFDCLIYIDNTKAIFSNVKINKSSRFLLGDSYSNILIQNISVFDSLISDNLLTKAPELICIIFNNNMSIENLNFYKMNLRSFDENK